MITAKKAIDLVFGCPPFYRQNRKIWPMTKSPNGSGLFVKLWNFGIAQGIYEKFV